MHQINPEGFIAWLITQPNRNGTLYLERVVRSYVRYLHSAPMKLQLPLAREERNVFAKTTLLEFLQLYDVFVSAPNFKVVDLASSHNSFSAGLKCYRRYIEHLLRKENLTREGNKHQMVDVVPITEDNVGVSLTVERVTQVLSKYFPYGYLLDSPIELMRFRQLYIDEFSDTAMADDCLIKRLISGCGMLYAGKIYFIDRKTNEHIKAEVDYACKNCTELVFYESFYNCHRDWLFSAGVISESMLRSMIERLYPHFVFKTKFFSPRFVSRNEILEVGREILRVWGDNVLMSYEQTSLLLQYIPLDKIKIALAYNNDFVWNAVGVYACINKFNVYDDELTIIVDFAEERCRSKGYASLSDLPITDIVERNYEFSITAVHNALFNLCLVDKYQRKGKIIFRSGDEIDALSLMKEYCNSLERCTLRNLLDYEIELTGESHRWIPMQAGYDIMVRLEDEVFVAEHYVSFDGAATDNAIDVFINGDYVPLKSITTFVAFPYCGQPWGLFLLESYCRRFSERYRFLALSVNSSNAGVIVRKTCELSLDEIIVDAVTKSNVQLEKTEVLNFLCVTGYIARRKYSKVNEIIERVRDARRKGD